MDYKVLYRKYRPNNFDEVVGQTNTIKLLRDSIINNKVSHAYIFSGPRGTGKTSTAKIFAKTINCLNPKDGLPCEKCENCINFKQSNDIFEIDAASNNGVDQVREIIDNVKLSPVNSKYKVYIIDEVHMLSTSAFNALLLTLEEPPAHAIFILATTNIESVPITILSRCQRLDFRKISDQDIFNRLKEISKIEKINITDEALTEIAFCADGGLRDALSILDQLSKKECKITEDEVLKSIGVVSNKNINDLFESIENNNVDNIESFIDNAQTLAVDFKSLIRKIIDCVRNHCVEIKKNNYVSNLGYENLKKMCFELAGLLYKPNVNINSYQMLELILLDYVNFDNKKVNIIQKETEKARKIDKKEEVVEEKETQKYFPGNNSELVNIRINNCFASAKKTKLNENKPKWEEFISNNSLKKLKGILIDTNVVLASDEIMVIKTSLEENAQLINDNLDIINIEFKKKYELDYSFIAICEEQWNQETEKYKENISKGIKYKKIEEPKNIKETKILDDVFSINKVKIK